MERYKFKYQTNKGKRGEKMTEKENTNKDKPIKMVLENKKDKKST